MKIKYIISIIILFAFILNSCDKVSAPYVESRDYCSGNKKVLIEDYTGHGCVNCPGAAVEAHELKDKFCNRVVIIGVHAGYFAKPDFGGDTTFSADFTTEAGNVWDTFFGNSIMGNPNGLIDRVEGANGYVHYPATWGETIDPLLQQPALALLTISNDFNTDTKVLSTTVKTNFQANLVGEYKLIVCITQDNIVAPQKNNDAEIGETPVDMDYVHNHVLRKVINGSWGESLNGSSVASTNTVYEKTYTQEFNSSWIPEDCNVVAFVYNQDTKTVLQVEELHVLD